jgi:hypothetical protein
MPSEARNQVFVSYSHKDKRWLDELLTHLGSFRQLVIRTWSDKEIEAGQLWLDEIKRGIAASSAAVLLVTPNFLDSKFIRDEELPLLEQAKVDRGLRLTWIAVRPSTVQGSDKRIWAYQALNDPRQALSGLRQSSRDKKLAEIAQQINNVVLAASQRSWLAGKIHAEIPAVRHRIDPAQRKQAEVPAEKPRSMAANRGAVRTDNYVAFPELLDYITRHKVRTATLIQMSCINAQQVLRELWRTNAHAEVFVSAANREFGVSEWQRGRVERFLRDLPNELQNIVDHGESGQIDIYRYNAPASIRAVLIDGDILTVGTYLYQKHAIPGHGRILDVRGGEVPLLLFTPKDPEFATFRNMIVRLVENWKKERVAKFFRRFKQSDLHGSRS